MLPPLWSVLRPGPPVPVGNNDREGRKNSHRHDRRFAPPWSLTSFMLPGGGMNLTGFPSRLLVPLFLTLPNF